MKLHATQLQALSSLFLDTAKILVAGAFTTPYLDPLHQIARLTQLATSAIVLVLLALYLLEIKENYDS